MAVSSLRVANPGVPNTLIISSAQSARSMLPDASISSVKIALPVVALFFNPPGLIIVQSYSMIQTLSIYILSYTDIRDKHIIITLKHNLTRFVYSLRSLSALSFAVNAPSSARYTDTGMAPIVRPHPTLTKQNKHDIIIYIHSYSQE
jgi:hypothetical protein